MKRALESRSEQIIIKELRELKKDTLDLRRTVKNIKTNAAELNRIKIVANSLEHIENTIDSELISLQEIKIILSSVKTELTNIKIEVAGRSAILNDTAQNNSAKSIPLLITILLLLVVVLAALEQSEVNFKTLDIPVLIVIGILMVYFYAYKKQYGKIYVFTTIVFLSAVLFIYNVYLAAGPASLQNTFQSIGVGMLQATGIIAAITPIFAIEIEKHPDTKKVSKVFYLVSIFCFISLLLTILSILLLPSIISNQSNTTAQIVSGITFIEYVSALMVLSLGFIIMSILLLINGILSYCAIKGLVLLQ